MKGLEVRDMEAAALRNSSADHQQYSMYPPGMAARTSSTTTQTPPLITQSSAHGGSLDFGKLPQMEMVMNGGVFLKPPYPFPLSSYHEFRQPPLLPLPMPAFSSSSPSSSAHFQSLPAASRGGGGGRGIGFGSCRRGGSSASPTHKKMHKGSNKQQPSKTKQYPDVKPDKRWISDPKSLPKHVTLTDVSTATTTSTFNPNMMKFYESVFAMAPPPSSLPMPKFSLKPKT